VDKREIESDRSLPPSDEADDGRLDDLLSVVWYAEKDEVDDRTREFLEAGQDLLHGHLARDLNDAPATKSGRVRAPFEELLAWVSRRRVVERAKDRQSGTGTEPPTESAYRHRWRTQTGYLRDLVVYALRPRMASPKETDKAKAVLFEGGQLDKAIERIAYDEVRSLNEDKAFRLQMVFQAILSHDQHVSNALRRVDDTNFTAWRDFYANAIEHLGINLRPDVSLDDFAYALQAAGEGVVFRSLLPLEEDCPEAAKAIDHENKTSRPLALVAMAMLVAFSDPSGDGKDFAEVVRDLVPTANLSSCA
jgi:hypothetical protein